MLQDRAMRCAEQPTAVLWTIVSSVDWFDVQGVERFDRVIVEPSSGRSQGLLMACV